MGQYQTHQHLNYGGPEEEKKKKGYEKSFEEIIVENFPNMEKEIIKFKKHKSPIQDKPKEKHTKTHTNQNNKDYTQRKNIKSSKGETTSNIHGKSNTLNS